MKLIKEMLCGRVEVTLLQAYALIISVPIPYDYDYTFKAWLVSFSILAIGFCGQLLLDKILNKEY